jgi:hypothetical protein
MSAHAGGASDPPASRPDPIAGGLDCAALAAGDRVLGMIGRGRTAPMAPVPMQTVERPERIRGMVYVVLA